MTEDEARTRLDAELRRTQEREPEVRAWVARHDDELLRDQLGRCPEGPLRGFTLGVKDVIATADLPTERGSSLYKGDRTRSDAACVALARAAGALVVGKTVTTEFAALTPAVTRNPHDLLRTPGGSSSGSAAAVADGMVRVAFGTQTVGSVIRPAAYCGVAAMKASHDLVPTSGVGQLAPSLDTVGWFARSVDDLDAVYAALAPHLTRAGLDRSAGGVHIGIYRSHDASSADAAVVRCLEDVAAVLEGAGVRVAEVSPFDGFEDVGEAASTIMSREAAQVFAWERATDPSALSDLFGRVLARGDRISGDDLVAAQRLASWARERFDRHMAEGGYDALLTFAAPGEAPPIATTGDPVFCRLWTLLGVPAIHLPVTTGPAGLPIGVQLVGRRWDDAQLLRVAAAVERLL